MLTTEPAARCQKACPTRTNVPEYIRLISEGDYYGAWKVNRQANVFPSVCGRVCVRLCEKSCKRQDVSGEGKFFCESVAIRALKRFAADNVTATYRKKFLEEVLPTIHKNGKKVAVIGSGPAGLAVANDLVLAGCDVTVYEAAPVPGGMLVLGIPAYRLPRQVIGEEIDLLEDLGVKIHLNTPIGRNSGISLVGIINEYDAVFVAAGAHLSKKLRVKGEEMPGVMHGVTFLRHINLGEEVDIAGKRVAVIGGGFSAADSARTAIRLGAKEVYILYRRGREEMPMDYEEQEEALKEGVQIRCLASPVQVLGNGCVTGLRCIENKLGEPDASGRREPIPIRGSEFVVPLDVIIPAVGQDPDKSLLPEGMTIRPEALRTSNEKVFIGGDFISGTRNVIEVIAEGHQAANAIHEYLFGKGLPLYQSEEKTSEASPWLTQTPETIHRQKTPKRNGKSFEEVERAFSRPAAETEAARCLQCSYLPVIDEETCIYCERCIECCPQVCRELVVTSSLTGTSGEWFTRGGWHSSGDAKIVSNIEQCIQCGICAQVCPTESIRFVSRC